MVNNISSALNAYQQALSRIGAQTPQKAEVVQQPETGFQNMVKESLSHTMDVAEKSEAMTIAGIQGKVDIQDVVLAVSNAEMALETVVAVRDTAIKAYQSILQMNI